MNNKCIAHGKYLYLLSIMCLGGVLSTISCIKLPPKYSMHRNQDATDEALAEVGEILISYSDGLLDMGILAV